MCGILLSAAILMILVKIVASDDAEPEFWPMAGAALIATTASLIGRFLFSELIGPFSSLAGIIALIPALIYICEISLKQALIVTVLYIVVQVILVFLFVFLFASMIGGQGRLN